MTETGKTVGEQAHEAVLAETAEAHMEAKPDAGKYRLARLEELHEGDNVRREYDLTELVESLTSLGVVLQPLLVRPRVVGGGLEIVAGYRRFRAAKKVGLATVPVIVRELTDVQVLELQLTENVVRSALTPLEEGLGYARLMREAGYTVAQLVEKLGKARSKALVYARMKLAELGPEGRKGLAEGWLPESVATALARRPQPQQAAALKGLRERYSYELKVSTTLPARDAIHYLEAEFSRAMKACPFDSKDATLVPAAGACTTCPKRTTNQTADLFEAKGKPSSSGDFCLDVACFAVKADAAFRRSVAARADGAIVLTKKQAEEALSYGSDYVRADREVHYSSDAKWGTLAKKLGDNAPRPVLAQDDSGAAVELYPRRQLEAAAKKAGVMPKGAHKSQPKQRTPAEREKDKARAFRQRVTWDALRAVAKAATVGVDKGVALGTAEVRLLGRAILNTYVSRDLGEALGPALPRRDGHNGGYVDVAKLTVEGVLGAMLVKAAFDSHSDWAPTATGYSNPLLDVLAARSVDVKKLEAERQVQELNERAATKTKGGAK